MKKSDLVAAFGYTNITQDNYNLFDNASLVAVVLRLINDFNRKNKLDCELLIGLDHKLYIRSKKVCRTIKIGKATIVFPHRIETGFNRFEKMPAYFEIMLFHDTIKYNFVKNELNIRSFNKFMKNFLKINDDDK